MIKLIREIFGLLNPSQRKKFYLIQTLVILMAVMELISIASIGPFMALVADSTQIDTNNLYQKLYTLSGLSNHNDFLFLAGILVLVMLGIASIISIITTWVLSIYSFAVGTELADRLYKYYLNQNWLFHANCSSAQLTKQIATETNRVTGSIILLLMQVNAKIVLVSLISIGILIYSPYIALFGLILFLSGYLIIYKIVKKRIAIYGKDISDKNSYRYRLMNEGFGGIKDILLLNRNKDFIEKFKQSGLILANAQGKISAISQVPRYFIELLAFGAIISLILVLLKTHNGSLNEVLPLLAIYALAGFKLLPALQQIYGNITHIKGNLSAFESIKPDLIEYQYKNIDLPYFTKPLTLKNHKEIILKDVTFSYPGKQILALNDLNLIIPINSTIGLVGASGSGKSTIIDMLLGLINPDKGSLLIDKINIDQDNLKSWQSNIGFVPQSIFLTEGTIAENIAFGLNESDIDLQKVRNAIELANLYKLIESLPDGLDTKIGERGVRLSGGQRQRIGIARALYNESDILIFDEATSALDGLTEKVIMDAVHELSGHKTIIMVAHRLKTVQQCDKIFLIDQGRVAAEGSYKQLIENSETFKKMSRYS